MYSQYELKLKSRGNNKIYTFHSCDGLNSKNSFRDEELLLADKVGIDEDDRILIVQSNYGFLGAVLGEKAEEVVMQDTSARACKFSEKNAEENGLENYMVENTASVDEIKGKFDKIFHAPADYEPVDLVKNRLADSAEKLAEDGELFIAGKKKSGLKRYREYLKKHVEVEKIGKDGEVKAYGFKPENSQIERPEIEKNFQAEVKGVEAEFKTSEGLFSAGKLDEGTRILLENIEVEERKVLDVGCGYGAISVFLGKENDIDLYSTDDNASATLYAERNLQKNGIGDFQVETADCIDAYKDRKFETVVSNPPTHDGKGVTGKIFSQAFERLKEGGQLWLVYNQNMKFEKQLKEDFSETERVAEEDNFVVLKAVK